jgi:Fe2+ or Zn2+ uptake regulation protein
MCGPDNLSPTLAHGATADWRAAVESALQGAGLRASSARTAVLDWIAAAERPFTAETIVLQLVVGWGLGSRPTVYRTVDWLRSAGWLVRLHGDGVDRAYTRSQPGAHQVICTDCGAIQTITDLELEPLVAPWLQNLGFELQSEHLELYGRCRQCCRAEEADRAGAATAAAPVEGIC